MLYTECEYLSEQEFIQAMTDFEQTLSPEGKQLMEVFAQIMNHSDLTEEEKQKTINAIIDDMMRKDGWIE